MTDTPRTTTQLGTAAHPSGDGPGPVLDPACSGQMSVLDWQRSENLRDDYTPPLVEQGHVTAAWFWSSAEHNGRLRGDDAALMRHATRMWIRACGAAR